MTPIRNAVLVLVLTAFIPLGTTRAAEAPSVSKTGLPYRPDSDEAGPPEIVKAIRERRPGGKLLNLDRMLLNSPAFAQGWNSVFGTIRNKLTVPPILREIAIERLGELAAGAACGIMQDAQRPDHRITRGAPPGAAHARI